MLYLAIERLAVELPAGAAAHCHGVAMEAQPPPLSWPRVTRRQTRASLWPVR